MANAGFSPAGNPVAIREAPLRGMYRHISADHMETGMNYTVKEYLTTQKGLQRRAGISQYSSATVGYPPIQALISYYKTDGTQQTIVVDQEFIYVLGRATMTGKTWVYSTGSITATAGNTTITGSGTSWNTPDIRAGDRLILDADGSGDGPENVIVSSVGSDTSITVETAPVNSYPAGTDYEIRFTLQQALPYYVDYTNNGVDLLIADGSRLLYAWNGTTFSDYGQSGAYYPMLVEYYNDRIFIGRTIESGDSKLQRIRWSGIGVSNHDTFAAGDYVDLPYTRGPLMRLVVMGSYLMAYFYDAVYFGRPTQDPNLPVIFQRVDTGNIGLTGMNAVCSWLDGNFFVGQNNIYFISNSDFRPIGDPIVEASLASCTKKAQIWARPDPLNNRIIFGIPTTGDSMENIFSFNYRSNEWSYYTFTCDAFESIGLTASISWSDLVDTGSGGILTTDTWSGFTSPYDTWGSLGLEGLPDTKLYYAVNDKVYYDTPATSSDGGNAITGTIITRDYDEGEFSRDKIWNQFSIKVDTTVDTALSWTVTASIDRGSTWKALGTLTIDSGDDEGKVNFRMKGQQIRFKLVSNTIIAPYTIIELTRRVKLLGRETAGRLTG